MATISDGASDTSITVETGPIKTFKNFNLRRKEGKGILHCGLVQMKYRRDHSMPISFRNDSKPLKSLPSQRFGKSISNLLCGWDVSKLYCSAVLDLSLPFALDFHMFCAGEERAMAP